MPWIHASLSVAHPETLEHGADVRVFFLRDPTRDWVEASPEAPHEGPRLTRSRPYRLDRALVTRGLVGELLAQEYLAFFPNHEELLDAARRADALRAEADETRWTAGLRREIGEAHRRLEEGVYAAPFPMRVVLTLFSDTLRDELCNDFRDLNLPRGLLVDAVFEPATESPLMRRRGGELPRGV